MTDLAAIYRCRRGHMALHSGRCEGCGGTLDLAEWATVLEEWTGPDGQRWTRIATPFGPAERPLP